MSSDFSSPVVVSMLDRGEVTTLQTFLDQLSYPPGQIDGLWGPKTKAAWDLFAENNGLDLNTVDATTWESIAGAGDRGAYVEGPGGESIAETDGSGHGDGNISDEELDLIKEEYPSLAYLLDEPEIGDLLREAVKWEWSSDKLISRMENTEWWQTTTANQRQFDASIVRDPATIRSDIENQKILLEGTFAAYGVSLTDQELEDFSFDIVRNGTTEAGLLRIVGQQARNMMAGNQNADTFGGDAQGQLASIVQSLQTEARSYHMGYGTDTLEEWAVRIMEGTFTRDAATATFKRQAVQAYPNLADDIERGLTVEDFYAPTKNRLAQVLDINPNDIDLTQDRWSGVTNFVDDSGNMRAMTYSEIGRWGRDQPEWWSTDDANAKTYGTLNKLLRTMGEV